MVRQYPYSLKVLTVTGGGFDGDGNPIPATTDYVTVSKCRDEANSGAKTVNLVDGQAYVYDVLIQLPLSAGTIRVGDKIQVTDESGNIRVQGTIKHYRKDQLHKRAWV